MKKQFTPGPWIYEVSANSGFAVKKPHGNPIEIYSYIADSIESEYDASLLAAAPELLDVLTAIKSTNHYKNFSEPLKKQVESVIHKIGDYIHD
jgi:hypothetical protein